MYNLIEYSDNYFDTLVSLWGFKRDGLANNADVTNDNNAPSFKYKTSLVNNAEANGAKTGVRVAASLKYLSNFWRSLEMSLINCKIELPLNWIENCVFTAASSTFVKITDTKLDASVVILLTEDNAKLTKQLVN